MRLLPLLAWLIAGVCFGQAFPPRGGGSSSSSGGVPGAGGPYLSATTAVGTYYVDPTGSDSGTCTATGTGACATLGGAIAKIPYVVLNAQTINVAAGTYTETISFNRQMAADLLIVGPTQANVTPTTGSATGTITAISNTTVPATVTASAATWTVNDFAGRFLHITSGAQSGQVRAIQSNTATVLTLASPFTTAPATSDTFAIRSPAAVFATSTTTSVITGRLLGTASSNLTFSNVSFESSNASGKGCEFSGGGPVVVNFNFSRCYTAGGTSSIAAIWNGGGTFATGVASFYGGRALQVTNAASSQPAGGGCRLQLGNFLGRSTGALGALSMETLQTSCSWAPNGGVTLMTSSVDVNAAAWILNFPIYGTLTSTVPIYLRCTGNGPSGLLNVSTGSLATQSMRATLGGQLYIHGCSYGVRARDPSSVVVIGSRLECGQVATACVHAANGARVQLPTNWFGDAGTDIEADLSTFSKAALGGTDFGRVPDPATVFGTSVFY